MDEKIKAGFTAAEAEQERANEQLSAQSESTAVDQAVELGFQGAELGEPLAELSELPPELNAQGGDLSVRAEALSTQTDELSVQEGELNSQTEELSVAAEAELALQQAELKADAGQALLGTSSTATSPATERPARESQGTESLAPESQAVTSPASGAARPFVPSQSKNYEPYQAGVPFQVWASPRERSKKQQEELSANLPKRRLRVRTFLIPLAFMFFHFFVQYLALMSFALFEWLSSGAGDWQKLKESGEAKNFFLQFFTPEVQQKAALLMCLILIPVYLVFLRKFKRSDSRSYMMERPKLSTVLLSLLFIAGAMGATTAWMQTLDWLSLRSGFIAEQMQRYRSYLELFVDQDVPIWLLITVTCVLIPIAEDLLFRGIIVGELRRALPDGWVLVVQTLLFAAFHLNFVQSSYVLFPAFVLGLAYFMSRNLLLPIFLHGVFNFLGGALPIILEPYDAMYGEYLAVGYMACCALTLLYLTINKAGGRKLFKGNV